jgi:hypothetical protein
MLNAEVIPQFRRKPCQVLKLFQFRRNARDMPGWYVRDIKCDAIPREEVVTRYAYSNRAQNVVLTNRKSKTGKGISTNDATKLRKPELHIGNRIRKVEDNSNLCSFCVYYSTKLAEPAAFLFGTLLIWRWKQYNPPKRWAICKLYNVTTQVVQPASRLSNSTGASGVRIMIVSLLIHILP